MTHAISVFQALFVRKIGRCAGCLRQALLVSLAAWAALALSLLAAAGSPLVALTALAALASTAVWLLHVAVHAGRATARVGRSGPGMTINPLARRQVLGTLLKAAGMGLLASVPVAGWSSAALAYCGQCTKNDDCGVGWSCKNTAAVNEDVCNECVQD